MRSLKRVFLSVFFIAAFALSATAQKYKISIKVHGIKDTVCYLAYHFGDKQYLKDTAIVDSKGHMVFEGNEPLPEAIYLAVMPDKVVSPAKKYFEFIVGKEQHFSLETDTTDYSMNMKVHGSEENQLFFDYMKFIHDRGVKSDSLQKALKNAKNKQDTTSINEQRTALDKEVFNYRESIFTKHPKAFVSMLFKAMTVSDPPKELDEAEKAKGDSLYRIFRVRYYRDHFFDNINFSDGRIVRTPIYHQKIKEYINNLTVPQIDSINKAADWLVEKSRANKEDLFKYTVWWITTSHETSNLMGADAVYVHMVRKYYQKGDAFWVDTATLKKVVDKANILEPLLIGKVAPRLVLNDSLGQVRVLQNVKAKYTVAIFWDPSCGHCQKEVPKLYEVYKKLKPEGVQVYAVNIDRDRKKWVEFIRKNNLDWINVYDPNRTVYFKELYDIYSTPVIYILDENKKIIAKRVGVEQTEEILNNWIKADKEKAAKGTGKK